jgi:hypothetical protein
MLTGASCDRLRCCAYPIALATATIAIPQPTEWQHIGNETYAAMIFMRELTKSAKPVGVCYVSAVDSSGRTIWIADAHRGKRFIVRADEELTAFSELESGSQLRRIGLTSRRDFSQDFQTPRDSLERRPLPMRIAS